MTAEITILDNQTQLVLGEIEVDENAYIYERINGKYTFKFSCYEQQNINLLAQYTLIKVDDDFFRISSIVERPVQKLYEVACEHVSYELNVIPAEEAEEEMEELNYEGPIWEIIPEMLDGTRFTWIPSDNIPDTFEFETKTRGIRSRILEFCIQNKLEANFSKFNVAIQRRRGADNGLEIKLGENLKDLTINKVFNFDNTITTTYDIDFIDLNKIKDAQGNPLKPNEFHMGDTVYLKIGNRTVVQRGVAVGYNPFRRELPTIELESPNHDITEVISDGAVAVGDGADIYQEEIVRNKKANALGNRTEANGQHSFAAGELNKANGYGSVAVGRQNESNGTFSFTSGMMNIVGGHTSAAIGSDNEVTSGFSIAVGESNKAQGHASTTIGSGNVASGDFSFAGGNKTIANSMFMTAFGKYNKSHNTNDNPYTLFALGNGTSESNRNNAFKVNFNGNAYAQGTFNGGGADYAEYFEWLDGNPNNEDRRGLAVAFEGDKIRLANTSDNYILGIVSVNPSIVGNAYEDDWSEKYLRDEYGALIVQDGKHILNPQYDSERQYVPRSQRSEWAIVGMLGRLLARDDGTCQINKFASLTVDGKLTHSDKPTQFFVLRRISENLIEILLK